MRKYSRAAFAGGWDADVLKVDVDKRRTGFSLKVAFEAPRFRFLQCLRLRIGFGLAPPITLVLLCLVRGR